MPNDTNNNYYINCVCGQIIVRRNMNKHIKTMRHKELKQKQEENEYNELLLFIRNCAVV